MSIFPKYLILLIAEKSQEFKGIRLRVIHDSEF
ncbi:hypothetical protein AOP6_1486 [Desulfuromonas sp. AOP6]|nr:hypothetical protein AOP6_1486 [Desulfuromonas sp. AOP6]